jgi:hypothetical protein
VTVFQWDFTAKVLYVFLSRGSGQLNICMQIKAELSQYLDCISTLCRAVRPPSQRKLRYKVLKAEGQKQQMSTESWYWLHFFFTCDYIHELMFLCKQSAAFDKTFLTYWNDLCDPIWGHDPQLTTTRLEQEVPLLYTTLSCCQGLFLLCHLFFGILLIRYNSWYSK